MMIKLTTNILVFLMAFVTSDSPYSGPQCLGTFCVQKPEPVSTLAQQLNLDFGRSVGAVCVTSTDEDSSLVVLPLHDTSKRVGTILVAQGTICPKSPYKISNAGKTFTASAGVHLGSTESEVRASFGKPTHTAELNSRLWAALLPNYRLPPYSEKRGQTVLFYSGPLPKDANSIQTFEVGIRQGAVSWLLLTVDD